MLKIGGYQNQFVTEWIHEFKQTAIDSSAIGNRRGVMKSVDSIECDIGHTSQAGGHSMKKLGKFFSSINNINHNIFFETLILIGTLCLLIMAYIIVFAFFPVVKANKEKNISLYANALNSVQSMIDYSLLNMHDILTKTSQENCIINAIVSPRSSSSDTDVLFSIATLSGENELIDKAFLYIPESGKVFDSKYTLTHLDHFYNRDIIARYYKDYDAGNRIERNGRITRMIQYGSNLFLTRDFPLDGAKRLGTFFIQLNKNRLFRNASVKKAVFPNQILIYDAQGMPLFRDLPADAAAYRRVLSSFRAGTSQTVGKINKRLFLYSKSDITQLQYFFTSDDGEIFNIQQIILLTIPIFFLCLLMALFITKKILIPIKNIIFIANNTKIDNLNNVVYLDSHSDPQVSNSASHSINDLKITFSNVVNSITHLKDVIKVLQPDILTIVFNDLLSGKPMQITDIANILNSVNSPISVNGIYNVLILDIDPNVALNSIHEFLALTKNTLDDKKSGNCAAYYLHMLNSFRYVIIFQFEKNAALGDIKMFEAELREDLLKKAGNLQLDLSIQTGKLCNSILDIQFSFKKACQQNRQNPAGNSPVNVPDLNPYYDRDYFAEHSEKFFELIRNNDATSALLTAQRVLNDIDSKLEIESARPLYNLYVESLFDVLLKFRNISLNQSDLFQIEEALNASDDWEQMKATVHNFLKQVISLTLTHYRKLNNQYIIKAENYIKKCYADPSLSLSTVAEYLNTNATYLSKLFKDGVGTNFNDYLNSYRIEKAKSLLCSSDIKIESVAAATGFNSQQNFIRVFKKSEGITPGHYRYLNQGSTI